MKSKSTSDLLTKIQDSNAMASSPNDASGASSIATGGAPHATRNGRYSDGRYTQEAKAQRSWVRRQLIAQHTDGVASDKLGVAPRLAAAVTTIHANHRVASAPAGTDEEAWRNDLRNALGGGSDAFVNTLLNQLIDASSINRDYVTTSESLSAALELIRGLAPSNTAEAALAVHVAQLHMASAAMNGRIQLYGSTRVTQDQANAAARLERAFLAAFQTYHRIRYGTRHVVQIERVTQVQHRLTRRQL